MFLKNSRYFRLPDVTAPSASSSAQLTKDLRPQSSKDLRPQLSKDLRSQLTKELRTLPLVTGAFRHTITSGERLDGLAAKYYQQPTQWWHICDANPQFLSPLALVGQDPIHTARFPLTDRLGDAEPIWYPLLQLPKKMIGVENVQISEMAVWGEPTIAAQTFERAALIRFNPALISLEELAKAIDDLAPDTGLKAGPPVELGQVGQQIVIPPWAPG